MAEGVDDMVVAGYTCCKNCGEWFVEASQGSQGRCGPCCILQVAHRHQDRLAYEFEGRVHYTAAEDDARKRRTRKPQKNRRLNEMTPEQISYKRRWLRARNRAISRLMAIYHPMFEVLLAEEKGRVGLKVGFEYHRPAPVAITKAIMEDLAEAAEREQRIVKSAE